MPHEYAQFQLSKYEPSSSDPAQQQEAAPSQETQEPTAESEGSPGPDEQEPGKGVLPISSLDSDPVPVRRLSLNSSMPAVRSDVDKTTVRRSLPSLQHVLNDTLATNKPVSTPHLPSIKKSTSIVRLSMTSEGSAQISTNDGFTPSPPRPVADDSQALNALNVPMPSLSSSQGSSQSNSLKRSASGRSRDSRAWEFWCDKNSRTELELKAEKDGKGSAADAISVIRATSQRKALQPLSSRQNAALTRPQPWHNHRAGMLSKRPPLQRAHTSSGRLQNDASTNADSKRRQRTKLSVLESDTSVLIPGNESDKENWSPGADPKHQQAEQDDLPKWKSISKGSANVVDRENLRPEDDEEVAAFMRGRSSSSLSGSEELDCVQGLLSLSQGRWVS